MNKILRVAKERYRTELNNTPPAMFHSLKLHLEEILFEWCCGSLGNVEVHRQFKSLGYEVNLNRNWYANTIPAVDCRTKRVMWLEV